MGIILTTSYTLIVLFLINKLRNIHRHPSQYNIIPGYEEYRKSAWFWPPRADYGKGTPPSNCNTASGFIMVGIVAWYTLSTFLFHQIKAPRHENVFTFNAFNDWAVVYIPLILLHAIALSYYIPMFSKKPVAICFNLHSVFRKESRSSAWEKMTMLVLISFIIIFPVRLLSLYNYGYITDERIVYNPFFSFHEQVFDYDEIEVAEIVYDEEGNISKYVIQNLYGDRIDVLHNFFCIDTEFWPISTLIMDRLSTATPGMAPLDR